MVKIQKILSFAAALMLCLPAMAQNTTGTITGRVVDPQGAVVPGAAVTVTSTTTNVAHAVTTNQDGLYTVPLLQPGTYAISVAVPNFKKEIRNNVTLQIGQVLETDFSLAVGATTQTVTVSTSAPLVQTQSAAVGTVIDNQKILEIPLNGRQIYNLTELVPGVSPPVLGSSLSYRGGFNVAGMPEDNNHDTLDGIDNLDEDIGSPNIRPSIEDIQEFNLYSGEYEAEYGHNDGGQLVVISKSGGNAFHGDIYEFLRNQITDAKNYFQAPGVNLALHRNDFGGTFGGPIIHNKMFFFFSTEFLRLSSQYQQLSSVPTTTEINDHIFPGHLNVPINPDGTSYPLAAFTYNSDNTTTINPGALTGSAAAPAESGELGAYTVGAALLSYEPAATKSGGNNYNFTGKNIENSELYELRIDNTEGPHDSTYGTLHYFHDPVLTVNNPTCGSESIPGFLCLAGYLSQVYGGGWTHIFTPNVINNAVLGYTRLNVPRNMLNQDPFDTDYNIPAFQLPAPSTLIGSINNGVPFVSMSGYSTYGNSTNLPQERWDNTYDYNDTVVWNKGTHSFKFGVEDTRFLEVLLFASLARGEFIFNGTYTGNPVADTLLGLPTEAEESPTAPLVHGKQTYIAGFAEDSWKVLPNLTLNYGLRWETETPITSGNNQLSSFLPATDETITFNQNGVPAHLYHADNNEWAPRLGVAYRPFKNDNTVVQAGGGIEYADVAMFGDFLGNEDSYPQRLTSTFIGTAAAPLYLPNPFVGTSPRSVTGTSPNLPMARNVGYSLGVEQKLTPSTVLTLTYQGSETSHIYQSYNIDQSRPKLTAAEGNDSRPYPNFTTIAYAYARGHANYNSLYVKVQQSLSHGLTYLASFAWGKAEDDADQEGGTVQNIYDLRAEKGLSLYNVAHRFVISPVYQLPFGPGREFLNQGWGSQILGHWEIAGEIQAQDGTPVTPVDASNVSNNGETSGDRPYVTDNPNSGPHKLTEWFNVFDYNYQNTVSGTPTQTNQKANSFPGITVVPPAPEPYGNARHGSINSPNYVDADINVARTFILPKKMSMQFRAEMYNMFNHPQFGQPGATFSGFTKNPTTGVVSAAGSFGHISQTASAGAGLGGTGRDFQFALKLFY